MAAHNATRTLERVRRILEATCEQDGQGRDLQETARRKAYRAGINEALNEIRAVPPAPSAKPARRDPPAAPAEPAVPSDEG